MTLPSLQDTLNKYSSYLTKTSNSNELLELGKKLFGGNNNNKEQIQRDSYQLLLNKENELLNYKPKQEIKIIPNINKTTIHKDDKQDQDLNETLLISQDRQALLLSRCKKLEEQKKLLQQEYGDLMEKSIQQKVQMKMEMQKLKAELQEALSRSRPSFMEKPITSKQNLPIMEELSLENSKLLERIRSFKVALSNENAHRDKGVVELFKPHMEKILGEIYAFSDTLSKEETERRISELIKSIKSQIDEKKVQLNNEHERNIKLQVEANEYSEKLRNEKEDVEHLKNVNSVTTKRIFLLKQVAEDETKELKLKQKELFEYIDNKAIPSSARAISATTGIEKKILKKSPSKKLLLDRESTFPNVLSIKKFIEEMKITLNNKVEIKKNLK